MPEAASAGMLVQAEDFGPGRGPGVAAAPGDLVRPDPARLFSRRAERLRRLSDGHPLGGYLRFVAELADVQAQIAQAFASTAEAADSPPRDWRDVLGLITDAFAPAGAAALGAIADVRLDSPDALAARGERVLTATITQADAPGAPFVMAALQITRSLAATTAEPTADPAPGRCPICGGAPVSGTLETRDGVAGLRYLQCGCCGTAWRRERLVCATCQAEGTTSYRALDGYPAPVKAECCSACGAYLKLFERDAIPDFDAVADDLGALALDLLLAEEGWGRAWPNPYLLSPV